MDNSLWDRILLPPGDPVAQVQCGFCIGEVAVFQGDL